MGQYMQIGIIYQASIPKDNRRYSGSYTTQEILLALSKNLDLNLFDLSEDDISITLSIKKEILLDNIKSFLLEQHQFMRSRELDPELLSLLDEKNYDKLITEVESKYFCDLHLMKDHTWYLVDDLDTIINFKAMGYFLVGKGYIECYRSLLDYMTNLIKHSTDNVLKGALVSELL